MRCWPFRVPAAEAILQPLTVLELSAVKAFNFLTGAVGGVECMVSRTGYTGEDGFELYCGADGGARLWDALMGTGEVEPAAGWGPGTRSASRRVSPSTGTSWTRTPRRWKRGLGWVTKLDKGPFIGSEVLARKEPLRRRLVGLEMEEAGIAREGYPIFHDEREVGRITSGTRSPTLGKAIALGYVSADAAARGTEVQVEIRRRRVRGRIVRVPFG